MPGWHGTVLELPSWPMIFPWGKIRVYVYEKASESLRGMEENIFLEKLVSRLEEVTNSSHIKTIMKDFKDHKISNKTKQNMMPPKEHDNFQ